MIAPTAKAQEYPTPRVVFSNGKVEHFNASHDQPKHNYKNAKAAVALYNTLSSKAKLEVLEVLG